MKSEHRHELKTNDLAEWISNFPSWAKENAMVLIPTAVVLAGAVVYFFWSQSSTTADEQNRAEFTEALGRLMQAKNSVAAGISEDAEMPLLMAAENLEGVAGSSTSDGMAAFAWIKRAEALRSAVFVQTRQTPEDIALQIEKAQASYREAQARAVNHKTLLATATYGLGLCAEELRQFDEAEQIYRDMIADSNLKGTAGLASAEYRLRTLDHYRSEIVFNEAPEEVNLPPVTIPLADMPVIDVNAETDINAPALGPVLEPPAAAPTTIPLDGVSLIDVNTAVDINAPTLGPALEPTVAAPVPVVETNTPE